MPLRDHFRPPVSKAASWEGFHGGWPMVMVEQLFHTLPQGFVAEPRVRLGTFAEIDMGTFDVDSSGISITEPSSDGNGSVATAVVAPPKPTFETEIEILEQYEYEVRIFDETRERMLVAAIEIVSPANKDRPETRRAFAAKCVTLLQQHVNVSIIDLITKHHFNLYTDVLDMLGRADPAISSPAPHVYGVTCHTRKQKGKLLLKSWTNSLAIGQPLPKLPIWLNEDDSILLDLEASYEETCRYLHIP